MPGDNYGSSGERAEVYGMYGPDGKQIFENETSGTQFYAISVYLPLDFVSPTGWGEFQQLHTNDIYHSYPTFAIGATDTYYVQMISGDLDALNDPTKSHTVKYPIGALQRGKWVDFVWEIKFAKIFTGTVDVWRRIEGETSFTKVLSVANIPTLSFKSSVSGGAVLDAYWKTGYYTSPETFTRVIYIDSNTRGDNFDAVVADAFINTWIFGDVPASYWANSFIERLYNAGITGGCSITPLNYCPKATVTRAQMAIFILRGIHGGAYTPPAATGTVFSDVPLGSFADAWIEQLALEGVTGGCGGGNYCPDQTITRAQMAIFLLRGKYGSAYTPPAATGTVFSDVPLGSFADAWIEQLALEGVTGGCTTTAYCPGNSVTRDQMAVFLVRMFNLP